MSYDNANQSDDAATGNANYYFHDMYSSIFSIEDVAVTDDYVIAVGRKDSYSQAYLYRIDKSNNAISD